MIVCKFGGSSISSADNIKKVKTIILEKLSNQKTKQVLTVFSAFGSTTDQLIKAGKVASEGNQEYKNILNNIIDDHNKIVEELFNSKKEYMEFVEPIYTKINEILLGIYYLKDFSNKNSDYLLSFGEHLSNQIIFNYFKRVLNYKVEFIDSSEYILTDYNYGNAKLIESTTVTNIQKLKDLEFELLVVPGFISKNESGFQTTLGRGGGDYTAAIFGAALDATVVEIWTDVNGIMSSDPRIVKNSMTIDNISYNEMMELSHYGANVIYTPTILPLYNKKIPIIVKNTFNPEHKGTLIDIENNKDDKIATAISNIKDVTMIKIYGNYLIGNVGFSSKLFSLFSSNHINIIMISQSSSEHSIYVIINKNDFDVAKFELNRKYEEQINKGDVILKFWNDKSVLSIETNKNENIIEISARIYPILKKYRIKVYTQITSDHNICLIIDKKFLEPIQMLIHDEVFFQQKSVNVILVGVGLVGKELIEQINNLNNINIICVANSKKMLYNESGLLLENITEKLIEEGVEYKMEDIIQKSIDCKLFNKVFIDCTSSEHIYSNYQRLLKHHVSVVTPNKKANTTDYSLFDTLYKYPNYKYETTVGAGLPIIDTIKNMIKNGDKIIKVEAILSGTLSYIFNTYSMTSYSFLEIVQMAQNLGFTEPNPKDDLNGMDVVRKILIISRLTGLKFELNDVKNKVFLSDDCLNASTTEEFYDKLNIYQHELDKVKEYAKQNNKVIKHVATLENGKAVVGLVEIDKSHPFYSLQGSDNMVIITSNYYNKNKLIIRGPGAGAAVTAAGVISDIYQSLE